MKKIINKPSDFVEESIEGLVKSHPDVYAFAKDNKRVITRATKLLIKLVLLLEGGQVIFQFLLDMLEKVF